MNFNINKHDPKIDLIEKLIIELDDLYEEYKIDQKYYTDEEYMPIIGKMSIREKAIELLCQSCSSPQPKQRLTNILN